jgi:predicted  nucleic acid-binding Zn-ribbon protein
MHDWVENLLQVQRIDVRMAKIQAQLDALPRDIGATEELQRADEARLAEAGQKLIELEKELKKIEMDVEALNAKKSDFQAKSTMIKNNEEYRAALHQIEQCDHQIAKCEDRELELMEALEEARAAKKECASILDVTKKRVAEVQQDFETRRKNSEAALGELAETRAPALSAVERTPASRYERLRMSGRARAGQPVLVPIHDEVCGRCRMNVTAQVRMNALKGMPVNCQNCGAMLYTEN